MVYFDDMNNEIKSSKNLIYVLHHPSSDRMYVGQTARGAHRFKEHFREYNLKKTKNEARTLWIKSMRKRGLDPIVTVLEECARPEDLDEAESFYISYFRFLGIPLLNHTDGGHHARFIIQRKKYTPEQRRLHQEAMKQRAAADPNYSAKMSAVSKTQWTDEKRKKRSEAMKGKENISPEARAKQAAALRGVPKSAEHRAALSEAKRLKWQDPVYRARQVEAQRAFHRQPEARVRAAEWAKLAGTSPAKRIALMKLNDHNRAVCAMEERSREQMTYAPLLSVSESYDHLLDGVEVPEHRPVLELVFDEAV